MPTFYTLRCSHCRKVFQEEETVTTCLKCAHPLDVEYDYNYIRQRLNNFALKNAPISALKYADFYPILDFSKIVSLKEGGTPLYAASHIGRKIKLPNLYVKNEGANPTGVFKDRGTLVEVTKALEMKAKAICLASSGNMAASAAAYASLARIPCYVLVPESTPIGKLSQSLTYGARVLQIRDVYSVCANLASEMAKKHKFYLAGDYVFRREGQKSQAFEIIEQLDWKSPDFVVCPIGCGTNLAAIWKGFKEFYQLGLIDKLPKLIGVQSEGCATVVEAFRLDKPIRKWEKINTICSAIAVNYPLDGSLVLKAIRESKGMAMSVTDTQALEAQITLGRLESIFVETSGALGLAAIIDLAKKAKFKSEDVVIIMATGVGLKDPISALKNLPDPPVLEPDMNEINRYIELKMYNIRASVVKGKEEILWKKTPIFASLKKIIKREFNLNLDKLYLEKILEQIQAFSEKSSNMRRADLQYIVENALKEYGLNKDVLAVNDFKLYVTKHKKPKADVLISFYDEEISSTSFGVGPVDAIITAIRKATEGKDTIGCKLIDYNVEIDTSGTDAVVEVRIRMKDNAENEVIGVAVSPDVIVASVDAFTRGYNALYWKSKGKIRA